MSSVHTTLRIEESKNKILQKRAKTLHMSKNRFLETLIDSEFDKDKESLIVELTQDLVVKIQRLLASDPRWAVRLLRQASRSPVEGILKERLDHYTADKDKLSEILVPLLVKRIENVLTQGTNGYILMDAGSTILNLCPVLWSQLRTLQQTISERTSKPGKLTIITSNYPVANSWTQNHLERTTTGFRMELVLVGGKVQPTYGALTGTRTVRALEEFAHENPRRPDGKYFTILAGNYFRIEPNLKVPSVPIPLVRGEGQLEVKKGFVRAADEIYLAAAAPGKIFIGGYKQIKTKLKEDYEDVPIPPDRYHKVKCVTALRTAGILSTHSLAIKRAIRLPTASNWRTDGLARIEDLDHICYVHDDPISTVGGLAGALEQLSIEFPHLFPPGAPRSKNFEVNLQLVRQFFKVVYDG